MEKFTIKEAAKYFGISEDKVYYWIKSKRLEALPSSKFETIMIAKDVLEDFKLSNSKELSFLKNGVPKGYFTADMLAQRFNVQRNTINLWIRQKIFKNVEKSGVPLGSRDYYLIPETEVLRYERKIDKLEEQFIKSTDVMTTLDISASTLHAWNKKGHFGDGINWKGDLYLSKSSVTTLKDKLNQENQMLSVKELSDSLGISIDQVRHLFKQDLQMSFRDRKLLLPRETLEGFLKEYGTLLTYFQDGTIPKGYYSTNMLAQYFKVDASEIVRWINQGRFKGVKKMGKSTSGPTNFFLIPENSVRNYEEFIRNLNEYYITTYQAADILRVSHSTIGNWITNKKFSGGIRWLDSWYIPKKNIDELLNQKKLISRNKASELLGVSHQTIQKCIDLKLFEVKIMDNKIYLDLEQLKALPDDFFDQLRINNYISTIQVQKPKGYLTTREVAEKLNITSKSADLLIRNGELGSPLKCLVNGYIVNAISQDAMSLYIEKSEKLKQCLKTNEAARYLNLHPSTLSSYVKKGYFPKAFKEKGNYFIPLSDLDEYKKFGTLPKLPKENRTKINTDKQLNKVFLLENLINIIKNFPIPNYIEKTREYYLDYISVRISSLNGHISHIKSECSRAKNCFEKIIVKLQKNCFELSDEKIQSILLDESYPLSHRTLANWFFQYVFSNMGIEKNKNFIIASSPSTKDDGKEIYSPEIYLEYLSYTKNIERHISEAIRSQHYVNMWLYTIMHLMDTWRATDIVNSLIDIDLEAVDIYNFEWFLTNNVTKEQAQTVINQIYYKTRGLTTSKTNSLLTFLVPMDFILPAGNAFIICELHRRQSKDEYLLQTLISNDLKARTPNKQHLNFFKYNAILKDFKSLVMNRSTMTYLFNSIVDEAPDPELALTYTQQARSHEKENTTAIYVKATNFDGSLGNVSLNLFNRGHFGWLYNTLIKLMFEDENIPLSIDVRTHYIMELRKEFTPKQLENWAIFLQNLDKKRIPILNKLSELNNQQIKELIGCILSGEMPSRNEHGSCLSHPDCMKPHLQSCYSCEYFIPQVYTIIHIKQEIEHLLISIETNKHATIIERDSYFLKIYLLLLNEAISVYGEKYIETFIDLIGIRKRVLQLSPLLI